ncbi:MAG: 4Fe-4S binding protein [Bacteroides sp.]|nr:4Fe-4S binding protein [Bacteroides sp.]
MIDIKRKETCVGCKACANICPKSCISLLVDDMGFAYPKVDTEKCINCHLCEQVCPILYPFSEVKTQRSFALVNKDVKQVLSSSSGGLFIELSKYLINNGGVVYGAVYSKNYKFVEYARATKISELNSFKGSKYVQADLDNVFLI